MMKKMPSHLNIIETGNTGKTKTFTVHSVRGGVALARIYWYPAWRRYALHPLGSTIWDASCLIEVTEFLSKLMRERDPAYQKLQREAAAAMVADMYGDTD